MISLKSKQPQTKKTMKDLASCFSNHAVRVAPNTKLNSTTCAVTSVYHSCLASKKEVLISLTWSKNHDGPTLAVHVDDLSCIISQREKDAKAMSFQLSHISKGNRTFTSGSCAVDFYWDVSQAKYEKGWPEPVSGFHVVMYVESEVVILVGDVNKDNLKKTDQHSSTVAETHLVSRKEQVRGGTSYTTKARFHPTEKEHKISINCEEAKQKLSVSVDGNCVVQVENLKWNFRGNKTIYLLSDADHLLPVDMMWDLHGWMASDYGAQGTGRATFMFLSRSVKEKCLWKILEEEDTVRNSFCFTVQLSKVRH